MTSNGASDDGGGGGGVGGGFAFASLANGTPYRTTDASNQTIAIAQLIGNAEGNGVKVRASFFANSDPLTGPAQFSYDFVAFANRIGAASGALQFGDLVQTGGGAFANPTITVNASHTVLLNFSGLAATDIDWIITAEVQPMRGAVVL